MPIQFVLQEYLKQFVLLLINTEYKNINSYNNTMSIQKNSQFKLVKVTINSAE